MKVDTTLQSVRPVVLGAVVRGVELNGDETEAFIKGLMDHQEKLHFALGRGRKRMSIGVHDLANLHLRFVSLRRVQPLRLFHSHAMKA